MKWLLRIFGVLFVLVGFVWIFQGINVLLGSFMSGRIEYSFLGLVLAAAGAAMLYFSFRPMKKKSP